MRKTNQSIKQASNQATHTHTHTHTHPLCFSSARLSHSFWSCLRPLPLKFSRFRPDTKNERTIYGPKKGIKKHDRRRSPRHEKKDAGRMCSRTRRHDCSSSSSSSSSWDSRVTALPPSPPSIDDDDDVDVCVCVHAVFLSFL